MKSAFFVWGNNQHRQCLIDGKKIISCEIGYKNKTTMEQNIKLVKCGSSHSVLLTNEGDVFGWGNNNFNQLGKNLSKTDKPVKINIVHQCIKPNSENSINVEITQIACGGLFTIFITKCGCLIRHGAIFGDVKQPLNMDIPFNLGTISQVSCGQYHVVLLLSSGHVACFGRNMYGQIGIPKTDLDNYLETVSTPRIVTSQFIHKVVKIVAGSYHTLCIDDINQVFSWGYGIPCGVSNGHVMQPVLLPGIHEPLLDLVGGLSHSLFLSKSNRILGIGSNQFGQVSPTCGDTFISLPLEIQLCDESLVTDIYCGDNYSIAKLENDTLYLWGKNSNVIDSNSSVSRCFKGPQKLDLHELLKDRYKIVSLSCGAWHVVCHLSPIAKYAEVVDNKPVSKPIYSEESCDIPSEMNRTDDTINKVMDTNILRSAQTDIPKGRPYSESPEPSRIALRKPSINMKKIQMPNTCTQTMKISFTRLTNQTLLPDKIRNTSPTYNDIKYVTNLEDNLPKTKVDNCNIHVKNIANSLRKSKTEFILPMKEIGLYPICHGRHSLKFPILPPRMINISLNKDHTFINNEKSKFNNKIKTLVERSKTYYGKSEL